MALRYTLICDGSSDTALLPILDWLLNTNGVTSDIQSEWADLSRLRPGQIQKLDSKICWGLKLYPCDLLFIHRDAEREPRENRICEINNAIQKAAQQVQMVPPVCVIPIRMTEAWLLFDEASIRQASGNPNGSGSLSLPAISNLEGLSDPKDILYSLLKQASGLNMRRLKAFHVTERARWVTRYIKDFSPLRSLPAFAALESDLKKVIVQHGWHNSNV